MKVSIHSIQSTLFQGEAEKLVARTSEGQITVLDHHVPIISTLVGPDIEIVQKNGEKKSISIASGVLEVRPESEVVVLAN